jgi:hypothetical protein
MRWATKAVKQLSLIVSAPGAFPLEALLAAALPLHHLADGLLCLAPVEALLKVALLGSEGFLGIGHAVALAVVLETYWRVILEWLSMVTTVLRLTTDGSGLFRAIQPL